MFFEDNKPIKNVFIFFAILFLPVFAASKFVNHFAALILWLMYFPGTYAVIRYNAWEAGYVYRGVSISDVDIDDVVKGVLLASAVFFAVVAVWSIAFLDMSPK